jgi:hypothetical protein
MVDRDTPTRDQEDITWTPVEGPKIAYILWGAPPKILEVPDG